MKYCPNCGYKIGEVPTEAGVPSQNRFEEIAGTENTSIVDEYGTLEEGTVQKAVPVISDYRERYKRQEIRMDDISPNRQVIKKIPRQDSELDSYRYKGDSLFFGPGAEVEY